MAIKVDLYNGKANCEDETYTWLGERSLKELQDWVRTVASNAPPEYRDSVVFTFEINDDRDRRRTVDGVYAVMRWTRPFTEEEKVESAKIEAECTARRVAALEEAAQRGKRAEEELERMRADARRCAAPK